MVYWNKKKFEQGQIESVKKYLEYLQTNYDKKYNKIKKVNRRTIKR